MNSKNIIFYILICKSFLFSIFLIFGLHNHSFEDFTGIFFYAKDTISYFEPVENFIDGNGYVRNNLKCSQFRQPIMLFLYGVFYFFLKKFLSLQLFVFLQFIMEIFISFYVIKELIDFFRRKIILILLVSLFPLTIFYVNFGLTEIPSAFFALIFTFFFVRLYNKFKIKYLLICSISLSLLIFSKPVFVIYFLLFNGILVIKLFNLKFNIKKILISLILFNSFFILFEICWIAIQKTTFDKTLENKEYVLLTSAFEYKSIDATIKKFFRKNALSFQTFDGKSHHDWLAGKVDEDTFLKNDLNSILWSKDFTYDSLKLIRDLYIKSLDSNTNLSDINFRIQEIVAHSDERSLKSSINRFVVSRILHFKMMFFVKHSYANPFIGISYLENILRKAMLLIYYFLILSFFTSSILVLINTRLLLNNWLILTSIWSIIFTFIILGLHENRYLVPLFPMMLIFSLKISSALKSLDFNNSIMVKK